MALRNQPLTKSVAYYDFSGGVNTKSPKEMIRPNQMPYAKNVLWDEKNRISKIWGVTELLSAANNAFYSNPIYNIYNYVTIQGAEKLIIQGLDSGVMSLSMMDTDDSAVTGITPTGVTLALNRRINFATHKGLLYAWNGVNDLLCWQGQNTATWRKYHTASHERFTYLATHNYRLWAAMSVENPIRVIYSGVNESHFGAYYGDEINPTTGTAYVGGANYFDFPTEDGTPVTGICEFQDSLLIFKPYHIFRLFGDPSYGATVKCISNGVGCFAHDSIAVRKDATVFFLGHDGIYTYGDSQMLVSAEDQKAYAGGSVIRLTADIDNYWASYFTKPDPLKVRTISKTADQNSASWTLTSCTSRVAPVSTYRPDMITFDLTSGNNDEISQTDITGVAYVDLQSVDTTNGLYDENIYYSQIFQPARYSYTYGIPNQVKLYLTNNGTLTSTQKINVFITDTKTDEIGDTVPDMTIIYAEGQYALNPVTSAGWYTVTLSYWDYPQALGSVPASHELALVVKPIGDTTSLYAKWGYPNNNAMGNAQMMNSDKYTPATQSAKDYSFEINCKNFVAAATVVTDAFDASGDSDFVNWLNVYIEEDDKTTHEYEKRSKLVKIEYATSTNGTDWGAYTETENGGDVSTDATYDYIKFRLTYRRRSGAGADDGDSFALIGIKATYNIQAISEKLVKGIIWEDRYILAGNLTDSGG